jgi:HEPN domain-containing protein
MRTRVNVWWEQARTELHAAEIHLREKRCDKCVFFCQQAVRKSLTACLLKKTRNLRSASMSNRSLIDMAKKCRLPERFHSFLRDLTSEYIKTCYPSATEEPPEVLYDRAIASRTLISAKEVVEWIDKRLRLPSVLQKP